VNKVSLTGRIANDLELKRTTTDKSVMEFNLAVKRDRKNASGEYPTDFIRVSAWEHNAEFLSKYARKGTMVGVTGRLETNSYDNKEGKKVTTTFITAETVEILAKPQEPKETRTVDIDPDALPFY